MPQFSIIVPVYNVEQYLKICVDSVLEQTYNDFELILVDDGSPDNCPAICNEYAKIDSRVHVIHQENRGLSAVALTDHNTVKGLKGFKDAAHGKSIECVNGVEISTDYMDKDIHIVGLFLKEDCFSQIDAFLEAANERKTESTKKLVHALSKDGYKIDYDEIRQSHAGQINRAVVAAELLK